MKEGWLKILKPVSLEITIFLEKNQNFEWTTASISGVSKTAKIYEPEDLKWLENWHFVKIEFVSQTFLVLA